MNGKPIRNLLIAGGVGHPAEVTAKAIGEVLTPHGIVTDLEEDILRGCERLAQGSYDLLTVSALRWRMLEPRFEPQRERWALSMPQPAREAIRAHLRQGGGLLALHTASICFDDWPEWGEILGARWVWGQSGHPPYGGTEIRFDRDRDAPLVAGLTDFACRDEVYQRLWLAPDVRPLAHARCPDAPDPTWRDWAPVLWERHWQGGRVVYDALGHDAASLDHPVHRELIARAALHALGRGVPAAGRSGP